jgi:purine nucleoside phosphorylase
VLAFGSTGSLKKTLPVGTLLVPDDWMHFAPISTFEYAKGGHVSDTHVMHCSSHATRAPVIIVRVGLSLLTLLLSSVSFFARCSGTGLDQELRQALLSLLRSHNYSVLDSGVYAQTLGPRFETPAEIRSLAIQGGDIVGMTCAHEATLCRELGLPYAVLCIIDNMANGICGTEISYEEFHAGVKRNLATMETILGLVLQRFAPKHDGQVNGVVANGTANGVANGVANGTAGASKKIHVDSLVHARWVVPILPAGVLENHSVAVRDGLIVAVLPTAEAKATYTATHEDEFTESVLMPGFVNAHSHLGMSLMRGYADDHWSDTEAISHELLCVVTAFAMFSFVLLVLFLLHVCCCSVQPDRMVDPSHLARRGCVRVPRVRARFRRARFGRDVAWWNHMLQRHVLVPRGAGGIGR